MNLTVARIHRYSWFLAVVGLVAIISGAYITSTEVVARQAQTAGASGVNELPHRILSIALLVFTLGAGVWTSLTEVSAQLRALVWSAFGALALDAALGLPGAPLTPVFGMFHALLAHFFFAVIIAIVVITSAGWSREPEIVDDQGWSFLRPLALATPPIVLVQIALGAAYRHQETGIMPHMAGAMVVALTTLVVSAVVLQNFPGPASLRRAAAWLISILLAQVCFGIAAFLMIVLNAAGTVAFEAVTVGHVAIGASTLAASVVMALQVWRCVVHKARQAAAQESI